MSTPPFLALPACARAVRLSTGRGQVAALVAEPTTGRGEATAVLVPGFTGSKEDFIALLAPLAASGWRVVALDQRGQFESPAADDPSGYDVDALADDLLAVIAALDAGPVHLVGHSFGGLVARAAAIADPQALRSLTLLDSGPGPVPESNRGRLRLLLQALPVADLATIWDASRALDAQAGVAAPADEVLDFLRRRFLANSPVGLARLAEQLIECPDRTDELAAALAAADVAVLVAHGADDDAWTPLEQAKMADRLGACHRVIESAGHSPAADRPEATAAVLDEFWRTPNRGSKPHLPHRGDMSR